MFSENHSSGTVPSAEQVSAFHIAQVYVGIAITLPAFLVAAQVFSAMGFINGIIAVGISGFVLLLLAMLTMSVGAITRLSTYAIIENVFGRKAANGINILLLFVLLGWFAVTISLFSEALSSAVSELFNSNASTWLLKLLGGSLMTAVTVYGFRAIDRLSRLVVPALMALLLLQCVIVLKDHNIGELYQSSGKAGVITSLGMAISILVGAFMVGVTIAPDVARFSRSAKNAVLASFLSFGLGVQIVFVLAGAPAISTGSSNFIGNMIAIGLGWPALFVIIFATLTTNVNNLYSVSLGLGKTLRGFSDFQLTIAAGSVGTFFAVAGFESLFVPFLVFLGIAIPPIAGVYVSHIMLCGGLRIATDDKPAHWTALSAWMVGSVVAFSASENWIALTSAPAVDGVLSAALSYLIMEYKLVRYALRTRAKV